MNADELEKFKTLLAAYEQALRLQRKRERTIETYCQYLWKVGPPEKGKPTAAQLVSAIGTR